jgi:hypothetical protein
VVIRDDMVIDELGGLHPLQGGGRLAGRRWYFRARHDEWSFWVGGTPDANPHDANSDPTGFYWIEPWPEGDSLEPEPSRALELVQMGIEAYEDPLAQLVCRLAKGIEALEWACIDDRLREAWSQSPVWLAVASIAVRLVPEPHVVRDFLSEFGITVLEVVDGTPLYGTAYDLVRIDEHLYAPSVHGFALGDEAAVRRALAEGLRARVPPPETSDILRLAELFHRARC